MLSRLLFSGALATAWLFAAAQPPIWSGQPDAAAFEKIEESHLEQARAAIAQLLAVEGKRTLENTLRPYDDAVRHLDTANYLATVVESVHPEAAFRDRASAMLKKAVAAQTELSLNQSVYLVLKSLDTARADAITRHYLDRQLLEFRLAGVDKDEATRAKLKKLSNELISEQTSFERNVADSRKTIVVRDAGDLTGLPADYLASHKPDKSDAIEISTDYPDYFPVMKFARSEEVRRRLSLAFSTRAFPQNREVLKQIMQTRHDIARTIGYASWADFNAADKMVSSGARIGEFIREIDDAARPVAKREFAMLLAEKRKTAPAANEIFDFEVSYLNEQVRRASFDFDSQSVRPYFAFERVKQGVLDTAAKVFHLTFRREEGVASWDPGVETWDALEGERMLGRFYLDMHPRKGKFNHAEMSPILDGVRGVQLPEAVLICNFPAPTASDPGLMEYNDVVTFFHEFGHLVHWLVAGNQRWAGVGGLNMEGDFVEAPSQMLEEWMRSPQVLAGFARHYQTGEPIPADLVARMNRASAFNRGNYVMTQNAYSAISYDIYKTDPSAVDPTKVCHEDERRYTLFKPLEGSEMYASFGHLSGYSSAYYTYMWDKVIAEDFFHQFDSANLLNGETSMRYRRQVLEPGGALPAADLVKNFLGRPQNMEAFKKWLAEEF